MARCVGRCAVFVLVWILGAILGTDSQPKVNPLVVEEQILWQSKKHTFRIPIIAHTPGGALIAIAERKYSAKDTGSEAVELRRSDNRGYFWSHPTSILTEAQFPHGVNLGSIIADNVTGVIFLWFEHCAKKDDCASSTPFLMNSTDDGRTWNTPKDMADVVGARKFVTGPGLGVQKKLPPYKGRLVTCGHRDLPSDGVFCVVSDDSGRTWRLAGNMRSIPFGGKKQDGDFTPDESQVVELPDGSLLVNMRNQLHYHCRCRMVMRSTDGGESFPLTSVRLDETLVDSGVHASMVHHRGVLFFTNPANDKKREDLKLRWSFDNGTTWPEAKTLWSGDAGYSCMALHESLDGAFLYVLYEKGISNPYQYISMIKISVYGNL